MEGVTLGVNDKNDRGVLENQLSSARMGRTICSSAPPVHENNKRVTHMLLEKTLSLSVSLSVTIA